MSAEQSIPQSALNAFSAIHDEATRLLSGWPENQADVEGGLQLIISLSRYKHDVRSAAEAAKGLDAQRDGT